MIRFPTSSSALSLLRRLSASSPLISSIPKQTHFNSSFKFDYSSSGYPNQTLIFQFPRFTTSMAGQSTSPNSIYDFVVKDGRGNDINLSSYKGKVLIIVNVASQCGLSSSNYPELTQLYDKYKDKGLEILAFPCNQFGNQEPGNNEQIKEFACTRFKAEFPIFDKVDVNGDNAAPVFKFLKSSKGGLLGDGIKWNFTKFLIDKDGNVVERYAPTTSPASIEKHMKKLLGIS